MTDATWPLDERSSVAEPVEVMAEKTRHKQTYGMATCSVRVVKDGSQTQLCMHDSAMAEESILDDRGGVGETSGIDRPAELTQAKNMMLKRK